MTSTAMVPLVPAEVQAQAVGLIQAAKLLLVVDQATLDTATAYLQIEAALRKKIEVHHAPMKAAAWKAHQEAVDTERRALRENGCQVSDKELGSVRALLTPKITDYQAECRRRAAEEQARLQAEERRRAEDLRLAQAQALVDQGVSEEDVEAVLSAPIEIPHVAAAPAPAMQGVSERWEYSAEVVALGELIRAVFAAKVPISAVMANQPYLNQRARSDKENFCIPGCRLIKVPDLTVRTRR